MALYRAEATRRHSGRGTKWRGKWHPDPTRAIAQAQRWRVKEPFALIEIATHDGQKVPLADLERELSGKPNDVAGHPPPGA